VKWEGRLEKPNKPEIRFKFCRVLRSKSVAFPSMFDATESRTREDNRFRDPPTALRKLTVGVDFSNTGRSTSGRNFSTPLAQYSVGPTIRQDMGTPLATPKPLVAIERSPFGRPFVQQRSPTPMVSLDSSSDGRRSVPRLQVTGYAFHGGPLRISSSAARYL
jgi:hypothetical protein